MDVSRPSRGRLVRRRLRQRRAAQFAVCLAALTLAVPALLAGTASRRAAPDTTETVAVAGTARAATAAVASTLPTTTVPATTDAPTTTVATTAPPTTAWSPPTSIDEVEWEPPTTTTPPATAAPTTAAPAPAPTPAPAAAVSRPGNSERGIASYYDDPNGGCAHKTLPFGTVVHVTADNGRTATCVVDDRGPFGPGRILDLDTEIFAQLAPLSAGLVTVTATW